MACHCRSCSLAFQSNIRDDAYGASNAPLYLLQRILTSIRAVLPKPFVLGVKISSSLVVEVARWDMVDFIEVSGGDYENPGATSVHNLVCSSLKYR